MSEHPFSIVVQSEETIAPVVAHVPYASTLIPPDVRERLTVGDTELQYQLAMLTDWHLDELFDWMFEYDAPLFLGEYSRLVFDPERSADDDAEPMASRGQGVLYTRGVGGEELRCPDAAEREGVIRGLYRPYHEGLAALVGMLEEQFGFCLVLDLCTFTTEPLPCDLDQGPARPDVCIGADDAVTPLRLAETLEKYFQDERFRVARNTPLPGTFVPAGPGASGSWVKSIRIGLRRGLYCDEATGDKNDEFEDVKARVKRAVSIAVVEAVGYLDHQRRGDTV